MERQIDIKKINNETNQAIRVMNQEWSFENAKVHLEEAFNCCSPKEDLGYYNIISSLFLALEFRTKNAFQTKKVRKAYAQLYEYCAQKFKNIRTFNVNADNDEEAMQLNSICVDIYNRSLKFLEVFVETSGRLYGLGIIPGVVAVHKVKKEFIPHIQSIAQDAAFVLRKYKIDDVTVRENIKHFESEK